MIIHHVIFYGNYGHDVELVIGHTKDVEIYAQSETSVNGYRDYSIEKPVKNCSAMTLSDQDVGMKLKVLS